MEWIFDNFEAVISSSKSGHQNIGSKGMDTCNGLTSIQNSTTVRDVDVAGGGSVAVYFH